MEKQTRNPETRKAVIFYTAELAIFAVAFLTLGILIFARIITLGGLFRPIYIIVTMVSGSCLIFDFLTAVLWKKRRSKISLFDKFLLLPVGPTLLTTDIIMLVQGLENTAEFHRATIASLFCYFGLIYGAQAVYHYFVPLPGLLQPETKDDGDVVEVVTVEAETPKDEEKRGEKEELAHVPSNQIIDK